MYAEYVNRWHLKVCVHFSFFDLTKLMNYKIILSCLLKR